MKIAYVATESEPFIKTGGLGDVVGALPKYLRDVDVETIVILPKYKDIEFKVEKGLTFIKSFTVRMNWREQYAGILHCKLENVDFYFIDNEYYFKREIGNSSYIYGHYDDGERFSFFDKAALLMLKEINFDADVIHCHDWHTGMIPLLLKENFKNIDFYKEMKTVFTIHNLKFQGIFPKEILWDLLELSEDFFDKGYIEYHGNISFMKAALSFSDKITTVSNSYALEIQSAEFGEGLNGLLSYRKDDLVGILNGIDYNTYNPKKDTEIYKNFSLDSIEDKVINKIELQKELGLKINENIPLIGIVTRLTTQKGIDLITNVIDEILYTRQVQLVVLGTGDNHFEDFFRNLQYRHKGYVSSNITFSNNLAHKIYAASDIYLMPSIFEPCGLSQLIALRYGSIPIVRETGGLKDTVIPFNGFTKEGNGFSFKELRREDLLWALNYTIDHYNQKEIWNEIIKSAMNSDNSWHKSCSLYKNIYRSLIGDISPKEIEKETVHK